MTQPASTTNTSQSLATQLVPSQHISVPEILENDYFQQLRTQCISQKAPEQQLITKAFSTYDFFAHIPTSCNLCFEFIQYPDTYNIAITQLRTIISALSTSTTCDINEMHHIFAPFSDPNLKADYLRKLLDLLPSFLHLIDNLLEKLPSSDISYITNDMSRLSLLNSPLPKSDQEQLWFNICSLLQQAPDLLETTSHATKQQDTIYQQLRAIARSQQHSETFRCIYTTIITILSSYPTRPNEPQSNVIKHAIDILSILIQKTTCQTMTQTEFLAIAPLLKSLIIQNQFQDGSIYDMKTWKTLRTIISSNPDLIKEVCYFLGDCISQDQIGKSILSEMCALFFKQYQTLQLQNVLDEAFYVLGSILVNRKDLGPQEQAWSCLCTLIQSTSVDIWFPLLIKIVLVITATPEQPWFTKIQELLETKQQDTLLNKCRAYAAILKEESLPQSNVEALCKLASELFSVNLTSETLEIRALIYFIFGQIIQRSLNADLKIRAYQCLIASEIPKEIPKEIPNTPFWPTNYVIALANTITTPSLSEFHIEAFNHIYNMPSLPCDTYSHICTCIQILFLLQAQPEEQKKAMLTIIRNTKYEDMSEFDKETSATVLNTILREMNKLETVTYQNERTQLIQFLINMCLSPNTSIKTITQALDLYPIAISITEVIQLLDKMAPQKLQGEDKRIYISTVHQLISKSTPIVDRLTVVLKLLDPLNQNNPTTNSLSDLFPILEMYLDEKIAQTILAAFVVDTDDKTALHNIISLEIERTLQNQLERLPQNILNGIFTILPKRTMYAAFNAMPLHIFKEWLLKIPTDSLSITCTQSLRKACKQALFSLSDELFKNTITQLPDALLKNALAQLPDALFDQVQIYLPENIIDQLLAQLPSDIFKQTTDTQPKSIYQKAFLILPTEPLKTALNALPRHVLMNALTELPPKTYLTILCSFSDEILKTLFWFLPEKIRISALPLLSNETHTQIFTIVSEKIRKHAFKKLCTYYTSESTSTATSQIFENLNLLLLSPNISKQTKLSIIVDSSVYNKFIKTISDRHIHFFFSTYHRLLSQQLDTEILIPIREQFLTMLQKQNIDLSTDIRDKSLEDMAAILDSPNVSEKQLITLYQDTLSAMLTACPHHHSVSYCAATTHKLLSLLLKIFKAPNEIQQNLTIDASIITFILSDKLQHDQTTTPIQYQILSTFISSPLTKEKDKHRVCEKAVELAAVLSRTKTNFCASAELYQLLGDIVIHSENEELQKSAITYLKQFEPKKDSVPELSTFYLVLKTIICNSSPDMRQHAWIQLWDSSHRFSKKVPSEFLHEIIVSPQQIESIQTDAFSALNPIIGNKNDHLLLGEIFLKTNVVKIRKQTLDELITIVTTDSSTAKRLSITSTLVEAIIQRKYDSEDRNLILKHLSTITKNFQSSIPTILKITSHLEEIIFDSQPDQEEFQHALSLLQYSVLRSPDPCEAQYYKIVAEIIESSHVPEISKQPFIDWLIGYDYHAFPISHESALYSCTALRHTIIHDQQKHRKEQASNKILQLANTPHDSLPLLSYLISTLSEIIILVPAYREAAQSKFLEYLQDQSNSFIIQPQSYIACKKIIENIHQESHLYTQVVTWVFSTATQLSSSDPQGEASNALLSIFTNNSSLQKHAVEALLLVVSSIIQNQAATTQDLVIACKSLCQCISVTATQGDNCANLLEVLQQLINQPNRIKFLYTVLSSICWKGHIAEPLLEEIYRNITQVMEPPEKHANARDPDTILAIATEWLTVLKSDYTEAQRKEFVIQECLGVLHWNTFPTHTVNVFCQIYGCIIDQNNNQDLINKVCSQVLGIVNQAHLPINDTSINEYVHLLHHIVVTQKCTEEDCKKALQILHTIQKSKKEYSNVSAYLLKCYESILSSERASQSLKEEVSSIIKSFSSEWLVDQTAIDSCCKSLRTIIQNTHVEQSCRTQSFTALINCCTTKKSHQSIQEVCQGFQSLMTTIPNIEKPNIISALNPLLESKDSFFHDLIPYLSTTLSDNNIDPEARQQIGKTLLHTSTEQLSTNHMQNIIESLTKLIISTEHAQSIGNAIDKAYTLIPLFTSQSPHSALSPNMFQSLCSLLRAIILTQCSIKKLPAITCLFRLCYAQNRQIKPLCEGLQAIIASSEVVFDAHKNQACKIILSFSHLTPEDASHLTQEDAFALCKALESVFYHSTETEQQHDAFKNLLHILSGNTAPSHTLHILNTIVKTSPSIYFKRQIWDFTQEILKRQEQPCEVFQQVCKIIQSLWSPTQTDLQTALLHKLEAIAQIPAGQAAAIKTLGKIIAQHGPENERAIKLIEKYVQPSLQKPLCTSIFRSLIHIVSSIHSQPNNISIAIASLKTIFTHYRHLIDEELIPLTNTICSTLGNMLLSQQNQANIDNAKATLISIIDLNQKQISPQLSETLQTIFQSQDIPNAILGELATVFLQLPCKNTLVEICTVLQSILQSTLNDDYRQQACGKINELITPQISIQSLGKIISTLGSVILYHDHHQRNVALNSLHSLLKKHTYKQDDRIIYQTLRQIIQKRPRDSERIITWVLENASKAHISGEECLTLSTIIEIHPQSTDVLFPLVTTLLNVKGQCTQLPCVVIEKICISLSEVFLHPNIDQQQCGELLINVLKIRSLTLASYNAIFEAIKLVVVQQKMPQETAIAAWNLFKYYADSLKFDKISPVYTTWVSIYNTQQLLPKTIQNELIDYIIALTKRINELLEPTILSTIVQTFLTILDKEDSLPIKEEVMQVILGITQQYVSLKRQPIDSLCKATCVILTKAIPLKFKQDALKTLQQIVNIINENNQYNELRTCLEIFNTIIATTQDKHLFIEHLINLTPKFIPKSQEDNVLVCSLYIYIIKAYNKSYTSTHGKACQRDSALQNLMNLISQDIIEKLPTNTLSIICELLSSISQESDISTELRQQVKSRLKELMTNNKSKLDNTASYYVIQGLLYLAPDVFTETQFDWAWVTQIFQNTPHNMSHLCFTLSKLLQLGAPEKVKNILFTILNSSDIQEIDQKYQALLKLAPCTTTDISKKAGEALSTLPIPTTPACIKKLYTTILSDFFANTDLSQSIHKAFMFRTEDTAIEQISTIWQEHLSNSSTSQSIRDMLCKFILDFVNEYTMSVSNQFLCLKIALQNAPEQYWQDICKKIINLSQYDENQQQQDHPLGVPVNLELALQTFKIVTEKQQIRFPSDYAGSMRILMSLIAHTKNKPELTESTCEALSSIFFQSMGATRPTEEQLTKSITYFEEIISKTYSKSGFNTLLKLLNSVAHGIPKAKILSLLKIMINPQQTDKSAIEHMCTRAIAVITDDSLTDQYKISVLRLIINTSCEDSSTETLILFSKMLLTVLLHTSQSNLSTSLDKDWKTLYAQAWNRLSQLMRSIEKNPIQPLVLQATYQYASDMLLNTQATQHTSNVAITLLKTVFTARFSRKNFSHIFAGSPIQLNNCASKLLKVFIQHQLIYKHYPEATKLIFEQEPELIPDASLEDFISILFEILHSDTMNATTLKNEVWQMLTTLISKPVVSNACLQQICTQACQQNHLEIHTSLKLDIMQKTLTSQENLSLSIIEQFSAASLYIISSTQATLSDALKQQAATFLITQAEQLQKRPEFSLITARSLITVFMYLNSESPDAHKAFTLFKTIISKKDADFQSIILELQEQINDPNITIQRQYQIMTVVSALLDHYDNRSLQQTGFNIFRNIIRPSDASLDQHELLNSFFQLQAISDTTIHSKMISIVLNPSPMTLEQKKIACDLLYKLVSTQNNSTYKLQSLFTCLWLLQHHPDEKQKHGIVSRILQLDHTTDPTIAAPMYTIFNAILNLPFDRFQFTTCQHILKYAQDSSTLHSENSSYTVLGQVLAYTPPALAAYISTHNNTNVQQAVEAHLPHENVEHIRAALNEYTYEEKNEYTYGEKKHLFRAILSDETFTTLQKSINKLVDRKDFSLAQEALEAYLYKNIQQTIYTIIFSHISHLPSISKQLTELLYHSWQWAHRHSKEEVHYATEQVFLKIQAKPCPFAEDTFVQLSQLLRHIINSPLTLHSHKEQAFCHLQSLFTTNIPPDSWAAAYNAFSYIMCYDNATSDMKCTARNWILNIASNHALTEESIADICSALEHISLTGESTQQQKACEQLLQLPKHKLFNYAKDTITKSIATLVAQYDPNDGAGGRTSAMQLLTDWCTSSTHNQHPDTPSKTSLYQGLSLIIQQGDSDFSYKEKAITTLLKMIKEIHVPNLTEQETSAFYKVLIHAAYYGKQISWQLENQLAQMIKNAHSVTQARSSLYYLLWGQVLHPSLSTSTKAKECLRRICNTSTNMQDVGEAFIQAIELCIDSNVIKKNQIEEDIGEIFSTKSKELSAALSSSLQQTLQRYQHHCPDNVDLWQYAFPITLLAKYPIREGFELYNIILQKSSNNCAQASQQLIERVAQNSRDSQYIKKSSIDAFCLLLSNIIANSSNKEMIQQICDLILYQLTNNISQKKSDLTSIYHALSMSLRTVAVENTFIELYKLIHSISETTTADLSVPGPLCKAIWGAVCNSSIFSPSITKIRNEALSHISRIISLQFNDTDLQYIFDILFESLCYKDSEHSIQEAATLAKQLIKQASKSLQLVKHMCSVLSAPFHDYNQSANDITKRSGTEVLNISCEYIFLLASQNQMPLAAKGPICHALYEIATSPHTEAQHATNACNLIVSLSDIVADQDRGHICTSLTAILESNCTTISQKRQACQYIVQLTQTPIYRKDIRPMLSALIKVIYQTNLPDKLIQDAALIIQYITSQIQFTPEEVGIQCHAYIGIMHLKTTSKTPKDLANQILSLSQPELSIQDQCQVITALSALITLPGPDKKQKDTATERILSMISALISFFPKINFPTSILGRVCQGLRTIIENTQTTLTQQNKARMVLTNLINQYFQASHPDNYLPAHVLGDVCEALGALIEYQQHPTISARLNAIIECNKQNIAGQSIGQICQALRQSVCYPKHSRESIKACNLIVSISQRELSESVISHVYTALCAVLDHPNLEHSIALQTCNIMHAMACKQTEQAFITAEAIYAIGMAIQCCLLHQINGLQQESWLLIYNQLLNRFTILANVVTKETQLATCYTLGKLIQSPYIHFDTCSSLINTLKQTVSSQYPNTIGPICLTLADLIPHLPEHARQFQNTLMELFITIAYAGISANYVNTENKIAMPTTQLVPNNIIQPIFASLKTLFINETSPTEIQNLAIKFLTKIPPAYLSRDIIGCACYELKKILEHSPKTLKDDIATYILKLVTCLTNRENECWQVPDDEELFWQCGNALKAIIVGSNISDDNKNQAMSLIWEHRIYASKCSSIETICSIAKKIIWHSAEDQYRHYSCALILKMAIKPQVIDITSWPELRSGLQAIISQKMPEHFARKAHEIFNQRINVLVQHNAMKHSHTVQSLSSVISLESMLTKLHLPSKDPITVQKKQLEIRTEAAFSQDNNPVPLHQNAQLSSFQTSQEPMISLHSQKTAPCKVEHENSLIISQQTSLMPTQPTTHQEISSDSPTSQSNSQALLHQSRLSNTSTISQEPMIPLSSQKTPHLNKDLQSLKQTNFAPVLNALQAKLQEKKIYTKCNLFSDGKTVCMTSQKSPGKIPLSVYAVRGDGHCCYRSFLVGLFRTYRDDTQTLISLLTGHDKIDLSTEIGKELDTCIKTLTTGDITQALSSSNALTQQLRAIAAEYTWQECCNTHQSSSGSYHSPFHKTFINQIQQNINTMLQNAADVDNDENLKQRLMSACQTVLSTDEEQMRNNKYTEILSIYCIMLQQSTFGQCIERYIADISSITCDLSENDLKTHLQSIIETFLWKQLSTEQLNSAEQIKTTWQQLSLEEQTIVEQKFAQTKLQYQGHAHTVSIQGGIFDRDKKQPATDSEKTSIIDQYCKNMLDVKTDVFCDSKWYGGFNELAYLTKHFGIKSCIIDVVQGELVDSDAKQGAKSLVTTFDQQNLQLKDWRSWIHQFDCIFLHENMHFGTAIPIQEK